MQTRQLLALVGLSLACHDGSTTTEPVLAEPAPILEQAEIVELPGIALARGLHRTDIVDVVLCPDASAVLTLDRNGGVRLWPNLDGSIEPVIIPIDDPSSLSFARSTTGYVIATLDTIGGAEVYEVRDHDGELRLDTRFSIPPTDPLFELHVLDGGERLLALGVDHRVRLYDVNGLEVSSIAEHGFVPWQLRHVETDSGVALVAILAGPTRVQPLELRDDHLKIVGEPFAVELDRGPNRNDLALTPDGEHIAAFSRRKWRSGEWQLQLHALADGHATLIEGKSESESKERPRMHLLDGARMLLDDGTGIGQVISLDPSAPSAASRPLPGSNERARLFTSVERGVRVVPSGDRFIVDRLDGQQHLRIGHERAHMRGAGLSPDGTRVIWALRDGWAIDSIDGTNLAKPTVHEHGSPLLFADFVDEARVVLVSDDGSIEVVDPETGLVLASNTAMRTLTEVRLARGESPTLLVRDVASKHDVLHTIGIDAVTAHVAVAVESAFIGPWYPSETPSAWTSMTWGTADWWETQLSERTLETDLAIAMKLAAVNIRELATTPDGGRVFAARSDSQMLVRTRPNEVTRVGELEATQSLSSASSVVRLAPSPNGDLLAVVYGNGDVGVHDARTLERQWTRVEGETIALGWSANGTRLVVAGQLGGAVLDAATGDVEFERRDFGVHVERSENLMPESQSDSIPNPRLPNR